MEGMPLRVLMVEDSPDDVSLELHELRKGGFAPEHRVVQTEPDFLGALAETQWDIVLSDFSMPRFNGMRAFELLLKSGLDVPFIFVSGRIGEERAAEAVRRGASDYILKDNLRRLLPAVERELRGAVSRRQRREADLALLQSEARLESIYQSLAEPVLLLAVEPGHRYRFVSVNPAFCQFFGIPKADIEGRLLHQLMAEPVMAIVGTHLQESETLCRIARWEQTFDVPSGLRTGLNTCVPIRDSQGRCTQLVLSVHDATAERQADLARRKSEARLRLIYETMTEPIALVAADPDGRFRWISVNGAFERFTGISKLRAEGAFMDEMLEPGLYASISDRYLRVMAGKAPICEEQEVKLDDGPHVVTATVNPVFDANGGCTGVVTSFLDVTERKQAEDKLHANERLLQTVFDTLPVDLVVKDSDSRYQMVNRAWCKRYGLTPEQVIGKKSPEISGRPEAEKLFTLEQDRKTLAANDTIVAEGWNTSATGEKRHFLTYRGPIRDESGRVTGLVGATVDLTELKRAEEKLRASERMLQAVFDTIPHMLVVKDARSRYLMVNKAWSEATGVSQEEALQLDPLAIPNRPRQEALAFIEEDRNIVSGNQGSISADRVMTLKDGMQRHFHSIKSPLRDENGGAVGVVAILVDFTAEKEAQQYAEIARARLYDAIESLSASFILYGPDEKLVLWNSHVGEFFPGLYPRLKIGMAAEDVLRLGATDIDDAKGRVDAWVQERLQQMRSHPAHHYEQRLSDGRWLRGIDHRTSEGGTVILRFDITDAKKREQELRQAQKMEAIGQLTGGIAHDFNNILAVIMSFGEMVLDRLEQGNPLHSDMKIILDAAGRAAALTRQLLAFGRRQVLRMDPVDLNEIATGMEKMLRRVIPENVELRLHPSPDLSLVKADRGQVEQIIMNLAVNARDAMPGGGILTIETANRILDEEDASEHGAVTVGPHVMMVVSDTGIGMDKETQAHVFEPFFTTKPVGSGTGLGLATVHGIVNQMGGTIWLYSEPGKGSTFKIFFPSLPGHQIADARAGNERPAAAAGSETILLVEDEDSVREAARRILANNGYKVQIATNGKEAVEVLKTKGGEIDCILSDVVMPGMNTKDLLEAVRKISAVPIVFMSGYTDVSIVNGGILEGGVPFLHKPFTKRSLLEKVREVLPSKSIGDR